MSQIARELQDIADIRIAALPQLQSFLKEANILNSYPHCADIGAVYLQIFNQTLAYSIEYSRMRTVLTTYRPLFTSSSALLRIQELRLAVYSAYCSGKTLEALEADVFKSNAGSEAVVAALELIPTIWKISFTRIDVLVELAKLYAVLCLEKSSTDVQTIALNNLADILDHIHATAVDSISLSELLELWRALPWSPISPSLSDALLRVSGCMMAAIQRKEGASPPGLLNWGQMVADAGSDDKVRIPFLLYPFTHFPTLINIAILTVSRPSTPVSPQ